MAPRLTRALVGRHGAGRQDTYGAALLDIAQDHVLWLIEQEGLFEGDDLIFKGGTSLRKCRLGNAGRFSTDLDFTAPDEDVVRLLSIEFQRVHDFTLLRLRRLLV